MLEQVGKLVETEPLVVLLKSYIGSRYSGRIRTARAVYTLPKPRGTKVCIIVG